MMTIDELFLASFEGDYDDEAVDAEFHLVNTRQRPGTRPQSRSNAEIILVRGGLTRPFLAAAALRTIVLCVDASTPRGIIAPQWD